ncbi:hypothetical protein AGLY_012290 [Aphis glycines]|uniref:Uncharacterized protein n=1 Tax=Aphis glycines TaxID=307491 RepID=A0A6G0TAA2_APHGL|nr:hypothetical protein AGLY_012290 [Aphis glycines]
MTKRCICVWATHKNKSSYCNTNSKVSLRNANIVRIIHYLYRICTTSICFQTQMNVTLIINRGSIRKLMSLKVHHCCCFVSTVLELPHYSVINNPKVSSLLIEITIVKGSPILTFSATSCFTVFPEKIFIVHVGILAVSIIAASSVLVADHLFDIYSEYEILYPDLSPIFYEVIYLLAIQLEFLDKPLGNIFRHIIQIYLDEKKNKLIVFKNNSNFSTVGGTHGVGDGRQRCPPDGKTAESDERHGYDSATTTATMTNGDNCGGQSADERRIILLFVRGGGTSSSSLSSVKGSDVAQSARTGSDPY